MIGVVRLYFAAFWLLWSAFPSPAQTSTDQTRSEPKPDPHHEEILDCEGLKATATHHVESPIITSRDLKSSAYVDTIAVAPWTGGCFNESRLYVKFEDDTTFSLVSRQVPEESNLGNKFILIDWSPDSKYLLFERMLFQYGSDAQPDIEPRLYAMSGRNLRTLDLKEIDKEWQQRECLLYLRPAGFSVSGDVIIEEEIHPYIDPSDDKPRDASCPSRQTLWEVQIEGSDQPRQLPPGYEVPRFGRPQGQDLR
jgi:hypothetical protein